VRLWPSEDRARASSVEIAVTAFLHRPAGVETALK
jgi:hypothetical protein